jgi:hypothetical protein
MTSSSKRNCMTFDRPEASKPPKLTVPVGIVAEWRAGVP